MTKIDEKKAGSGMADPASYTLIADLATLMPEIPPDTIISRSVYSGDELKGTLFGFAEGQELTEHTAARPAVLHFVSGEASLQLGDDAFIARPGTWVHMPAHLPHSIVAHSEVMMLLLLLR
jgi:quercetin dioxygenase-like cupin family protein